MGIYHRPRKLKDALMLLSEGADLRVAAGCTDLFPATTSQSLSGAVLDITDIEGLRGVTQTEGGWRIGAATTWTDVLRADLPDGFGALKDAAREVGSVQIQNAGTVGGNLCNASPAADGVPALLVLDAEVEIAGTVGVRRMPLETFLTGVRQTALGPGEMLTAVHVPRASGAGRGRFEKLGARKYLVISIAMAAVRVVEEAGVISEASIAVGACSPVARRLGAVEKAVMGLPVTEAAQAVRDTDVAGALAPIGDVRGSADYRNDAASELVRRALRGVGP